MAPPPSSLCFCLNWKLSTHATSTTFAIASTWAASAATRSVLPERWRTDAPLVLIALIWQQQILLDILDLLQTDGDSDQAVADPGLGAGLGAPAPMGGRRRMGDGRLDVTEVGGN